MDILFIDTETTGLNPEENDVIQIAAVYYKNDIFHSEKNIKLTNDYPTKTNLGALAVNRTSFKTLYTRKNNSDKEEALKEFCDWILTLPKTNEKENIYIAGQNVKFDINFMNSCLARYGITGFEDIFNRAPIDTMQIGQFLRNNGLINSYSNSLIYLAQALGVNVDNSKAHDALYDTKLCVEVYYKMCDLVKGVESSNKRTSWITVNESKKT